MMAPKPADEGTRIEALRRYDILDSEDETVFDDLARLAADICETPISLISLVDVDRQWFKARHGMCCHETPRTISFCAHAILAPSTPLVVRDALADARFADNDLVVAEPHMRFYAASPLLTQDNFALGTICVIDRVPRELTAKQLSALQTLGRQVMQQLEFRRAGAELARTKRQLEAALQQSNVERNRIEEALRSSEQRFGAYMRTMPLIAFMKDIEGRLLYVNKAFEKAFNMNLADWYGKTDAEIWPPETARQLRENDLKILQGADAVTVEETVLTPDGLQHWISYKFPFHDEGQMYLAGTAINITGRKRTEEQLRQTQKMNAIGQLAGGVAHDFNNLLSIILGLAELAQTSTDSESQAAHYLESIIEAAKRGGNLTQQLLAFARKKIVKPEVISLNRIITQLEPLLRRLIGEDLDFVLVEAKNLGLIKVDVGSIEQVIMNLTINARDAMPKGGKLTIETLNVTLGEDYAASNAEVKPGQYVMLAVTDTGLGIPEDIRPHIFEPFFTTKPAGQGTGLGLAMSHGIVKQAGGHIAVYSEVGKGSTFKIYLPLAQETIEATKMERDVRPLRGGTETILFVEDEPLLRDVARRSLSGLGYRVVDAANGEEAMERLSSLAGRVDLLVTDVVMPKMSGIELAKTLTHRCQGIKVLYSSGYTENAIVHQGILHESINFIQKPYTQSALAKRIRKILDE